MYKYITFILFSVESQRPPHLICNISQPRQSRAEIITLATLLILTVVS